MKNVILILLSICLFIPVNLISQTQLLNFSTIPLEVEKYASQFCQLQINAQDINPFDVNDIRIDMLINTPSGENIIQLGFFDSEQGDVSFWGARFSPADVGNYSHQIKIQNQSGTIITKSFLVNVKQQSYNDIKLKIPGFNKDIAGMI